MSRLVVVLPLAPLRTGESFAVVSWPLHVTLLPPFRTDADPDVIAEVIASAARPAHALTVTAGDDELFGRRENILVPVLAPNDELTLLHQWVADAARPYATHPDEPVFTGSRFRAHVTVKGAARVYAGDTFALTQIAVVDMAPRASAHGRTVLATIPLTAAQAD